MELLDAASSGRTALAFLFLMIAAVSGDSSTATSDGGRSLYRLTIRDRAFSSSLPVVPLPEGFTFIRPVVIKEPISKPESVSVTQMVNKPAILPLPPKEPTQEAVIPYILNPTPDTTESTVMPPREDFKPSFPYPPPLTDHQVLNPNPPAMPTSTPTSSTVSGEHSQVGNSMFRIDADGNYLFKFENDVYGRRFEEGSLKSIGYARVPVKKGYFTSQNGDQLVSYEADELGFRITRRMQLS